MDYKISIEDELNQHLIDGTQFGSINDDIEREDKKDEEGSERQTMLETQNNQQIESIETLTINKESRGHPQYLQPRYDFTFQIVLYGGIAYVMAYLIIAVVMNIVLVSSGDFSVLSTGLTSCPKYLLGIFVAVETFPPIGFLASYLLMEYITRRLHANVNIYTFNSNRWRVKLISFSSKWVKGGFMIFDIIQIGISIATKIAIDYSPNDTLLCKDEVGTFYVIAYIMMVVGFLCIVRLLYLIFPHCIGYMYFSYKQHQDTLLLKRVTQDLNVYTYQEYFRQKKFMSCKICHKEFNENEKIVELSCQNKHIQHKDCADTWFNTQYHLNCPNCLEFMYPRKVTFEIKRIVSTKNTYLAPRSNHDFNIKRYLRFFYFWPSIIYVCINIAAFEVGFQIIDVDSLPNLKPIFVVSTIACFAPIFNMLLSIMMYWNTFRGNMLYSRQYLYSNGKCQMRLTSLKSRINYLVIAAIDLVQIALSLISLIYAQIYAEDLAYLKDKFSFGYGYFIFQITVGVACIIRLSFLVFPHIIGHSYYQWREIRDDEQHKKSMSKNLLQYQYREIIQDIKAHDAYKLDNDSVNFFRCKVCARTFEDYEDIVELVCNGEHIIHKGCADQWFNVQKHINCPVCLEFILTQQRKPLNLSRTPGNSHYLK
ncbi:ring finger domain protein [Stylonychia lemnae]|uniref:Ring finger domain protein n=1 Tax=Stylonychia lemnae TaxID=5949 RepID=A0A078B6T3_STYLE|nr:ring finger domain protein [Stylonychia lemnae]|eukprot:CDW90250.1 ring finger domain protein [Stylonychia lemnae]